MKKTLIVEVISFLLVVLFLYTATSKALSYETFFNQIEKSPLFKDAEGWKLVAPQIAWIIPFAEVVVSIALITTRLRLAGFVGAFGLMLIFTLYILYILNFAPFVPCSCGGVLESMTWSEHLYFNIFFLLISAIGAVLWRSLTASLKEYKSYVDS